MNRRKVKGANYHSMNPLLRKMYEGDGYSILTSGNILEPKSGRRDRTYGWPGDKLKRIKRKLRNKMAAISRRINFKKR